MKAVDKKVELNFLNSLYSKEAIFNNSNILLNIINDNSINLINEIKPMINELEIEKLTNQDYNKYGFETENKTFIDLIGEGAITKEAILLKKSYERYSVLTKRLEISKEYTNAKEDIKNYQEILKEKVKNDKISNKYKIFIQNGVIEISDNKTMERYDINNIEDIKQLLEKYKEKDEKNIVKLFKGYMNKLENLEKLKKNSFIEPLTETEIAEILKYASVFDNVIPKIEDFINTRKLNIGAELLIDNFLYSESDDKESKTKKEKYYKYLNKNLFNLGINDNENLYLSLEKHLALFEDKLNKEKLEHTPENLFYYLATLSKEEIEQLSDEEKEYYKLIRNVRNNIEGIIRKIFNEKIEIYKNELKRLEKQLTNLLSNPTASKEEIISLFKKIGKTIKTIEMNILSSLEEVYDFEKMRIYDNNLYSEIESNIVTIVGSIVIPDITKKLNVSIDVLLKETIQTHKKEEWQSLLLEKTDILKSLTNEKFNTIEELEYKLVELGEFLTEILQKKGKYQNGLFTSKAIKEEVKKEEQTFTERVLFEQKEEFMENLKEMFQKDNTNFFGKIFGVTTKKIFKELEEELQKSSILPEEFFNDDLTQISYNYQRFVEKYKLFDFMSKEEKQIFNETLNDFKNEIDEMILKLLRKGQKPEIEENRQKILKKFVKLENILSDNIQILQVFKEIKKEQQQAAKEKNILKLINLEISKEVTLELPNLINEITNAIKIEDFNNLNEKEREIAILSRIEQLVNSKLLLETEKYKNAAKKILEKFDVVIETNGTLSVGIGYSVNKNLVAKTSPILSLAIENIANEAVKYYIKNNKERLVEKANNEIRKQLGVGKEHNIMNENTKLLIKNLIYQEKEQNKDLPKNIEWKKLKKDLNKERKNLEEILKNYFVLNVEKQLDKLQADLPEEIYNQYKNILSEILSNVPNVMLEKLILSNEEYKPNEIITLMQNSLTPYIYKMGVLNNEIQKILDKKLEGKELQKLYNLTKNNELMLLPEQIEQKIINEEKLEKQKEITAKIFYNLLNGKKISNITLKTAIDIQGTLRSLKSYFEKNKITEDNDFIEFINILEKEIDNLINTTSNEYINLEKFLFETNDIVSKIKILKNKKSSIIKILDKYLLKKNNVEYFEKLSRQQIFLFEDLNKINKNTSKLRNIKAYMSNKISDNMGYNVISNNINYFVSKGIENNSINNELLLGIPDFKELFGTKSIKELTTEERRKIKNKIASLSNKNEVYTIIQNIKTINNKSLSELLLDFKTYGSNIGKEELKNYDKKEILNEYFQKEILYFEYDSKNSRIQKLIPDLENIENKNEIQQVRNDLSNIINEKLKKIRKLSSKTEIENIDNIANKIANEIINGKTLKNLIQNNIKDIGVQEQLYQVINKKELKRHIKYTIINYVNNNFSFGQFKISINKNKLIEEKINEKQKNFEKFFTRLKNNYLIEKGLIKEHLILNKNKNKINQSSTYEERKENAIENMKETINQYNNFINKLVASNEIEKILEKILNNKYLLNNINPKEKETIIKNIKQNIEKKFKTIDIKENMSEEEIKKYYELATNNSVAIFKSIKNNINYLFVNINKIDSVLETILFNIDKSIEKTNKDFNNEKTKLEQNIENLFGKINSILVSSNDTLLNQLILNVLVKEFEIEEISPKMLDNEEIKFRIEENLSIEEIINDTKTNFKIAVSVISKNNTKKEIYLNINKVAYLKEIKNFINSKNFKVNNKYKEEYNNLKKEIEQYKEILNEKIDNSIKFYNLKESINKKIENKFKINSINLFEIFSYLDAEKSAVQKEEIWLDFKDLKVKNSINNLLFDFEVEDFKRTINEEFGNYYSLIYKDNIKIKEKKNYEKIIATNISEIAKKIDKKNNKIEQQLKIFEDEKKLGKLPASSYYAKIITNILFTKEMYKMSNILNILNNNEADKKENLDIYSKMFLYVKNEVLNELHYEIDKGKIKTIKDLKLKAEKLMNKHIRILKINNSLNTNFDYLEQLKYILKNYKNQLLPEQVDIAYKILDIKNKEEAKNFIEKLHNNKLSNFAKLKIILQQKNLKKNIKKEIENIVNNNLSPEEAENKAIEFLNKHKNLWKKEYEISNKILQDEIKMKELNEFKNYLLNNLSKFMKEDNEKFNKALEIIQKIKEQKNFEEIKNFYLELTEEKLYNEFLKNSMGYLTHKDIKDDLYKKEYFVETIHKTINQEKSLMFANLLDFDNKNNIRTEDISLLSVMLEKIFDLTPEILENKRSTEKNENIIIKKTNLTNKELLKVLKTIKKYNLTFTDLKYIKFLIDKNIIENGELNEEKLFSVFYGNNAIKNKKELSKELKELFSLKILDFIKENKNDLTIYSKMVTGIEKGIQIKIRNAQSNLEKYKKTESIEKISEKIHKNIIINKKHTDFIVSLIDKYQEQKNTKKIIYVFGNTKPDLNTLKFKKLYKPGEEVEFRTITFNNKTKNAGYFVIIKEIDKNTGKILNYQIKNLENKNKIKIFLNDGKKLKNYNNKKFSLENFKKLSIQINEKKLSFKSLEKIPGLLSNEEITELQKRKKIERFFINFNNIVKMYTIVENNNIKNNSIYFDYNKEKLKEKLDKKEIDIDKIYSEIIEFENAFQNPNKVVFKNGTYELKRDFYNKLVNFFRKFGFTFKFNHFISDNIEIDAKGNIKFYNPNTGLIENIAEEKTTYTDRKAKKKTLFMLRSNVELKDKFDNYVNSLFSNTRNLIDNLNEKYAYQKFNENENKTGKSNIENFDQNYKKNQQRIKALEEEIDKYKKEKISVYEYDKQTNKIRKVEISLMELLSMEKGQNKKDSINTLTKLENLTINNRILTKAKEELQSEGINSEHLDYNQKLYQRYEKLLNDEFDKINLLEPKERKKAIENFEKEFITTTNFAGTPIREVIVNARRNLEELEKQLKKEKDLKRRMDLALKDETISYLIYGKDLTQRNIYERHNVKALKANKWDEAVRYLDQAIEYYQKIVNQNPYNTYAKNKLAKLQNKREYLENQIKKGIDITTPEGLSELKDRLKEYEEFALFAKSWYETRKMAVKSAVYTQRFVADFFNIFSGIPFMQEAGTMFKNMRFNQSPNASYGAETMYGY